MHRIEGENVDTTEGKNLFRTEAPYTTQTPDWTNAVQEEIMNIVDEAGLETLFSDNDTRNQLLAALQLLFASISDKNPSGTILSFAGTSVPDGYLDCDGSAISRTTYLNLFNAIGVTWGIGDGSTTFNLPDLRGAFLRGTGSHGSETMADGNPFAGPSVGSFEDDQFQDWQLGAVGPSYGRMAGTAEGTGAAKDYIEMGAYQGDANQVKAYSNGTNGTPRLGDETRPFAAGIKYIIKY